MKNSSEELRKKVIALVAESLKKQDRCYGHGDFGTEIVLPIRCGYTGETSPFLKNLEKLLDHKFFS